MRRTLLRAGQKILYGFWLLAWPITVWQWASRTGWLHPKQRLYFRENCIIGVVPAVMVAAAWLNGFDLGAFDFAILYYMPWGSHTIAKACKIAERRSR